LQEEKVLYSTTAVKFDRRTYKTRERLVFVTPSSVLFIDPENGRLVYRLEYSNLAVLTFALRCINLFIYYICPMRIIAIIFIAIILLLLLLL
jgi:hypothetical protein